MKKLNTLLFLMAAMVAFILPSQARGETKTCTVVMANQGWTANQSPYTPANEYAADWTATDGTVFATKAKLLTSWGTYPTYHSYTSSVYFASNDIEVNITAPEGYKISSIEVSQSPDKALVDYIINGTDVVSNPTETSTYTFTNPVTDFIINTAVQSKYFYLKEMTITLEGESGGEGGDTPGLTAKDCDVVIANQGWTANQSPYTPANSYAADWTATNGTVFATKAKLLTSWGTYPTYHSNSSSVYFASNDIEVGITAPEGYKISGITVTQRSGYTPVNYIINGTDVVSNPAETSTYTFTNPVSDFTINTAVQNQYFYLKQMTISLVPADGGDEPAEPTIPEMGPFAIDTPSGKYPDGTEVTISCPGATHMLVYMSPDLSGGYGYVLVKGNTYTFTLDYATSPYYCPQGAYGIWYTDADCDNPMEDEEFMAKYGEKAVYQQSFFDEDENPLYYYQVLAPAAPGVTTEDCTIKLYNQGWTNSQVVYTSSNNYTVEWTATNGKIFTTETTKNDLASYNYPTYYTQSEALALASSSVPLKITPPAGSKIKSFTLSQRDYNNYNPVSFRVNGSETISNPTRTYTFDFAEPVESFTIDGYYCYMKEMTITIVTEGGEEPAEPTIPEMGPFEIDTPSGEYPDGTEVTISCPGATHMLVYMSPDLSGGYGYVLVKGNTYTFTLDYATSPYYCPQGAYGIWYTDADCDNPMEDEEFMAKYGEKAQYPQSFFDEDENPLYYYQVTPPSLYITGGLTTANGKTNNYDYSAEGAGQFTFDAETNVYTFTQTATSNIGGCRMRISKATSSSFEGDWGKNVIRLKGAGTSSQNTLNPVSVGVEYDLETADESNAYVAWPTAFQLPSEWKGLIKVHVNLNTMKLWMETVPVPLDLADIASTTLAEGNLYQLLSSDEMKVTHIVAGESNAVYFANGSNGAVVYVDQLPEGLTRGDVVNKVIATYTDGKFTPDEFEWTSSETEPAPVKVEVENLSDHANNFVTVSNVASDALAPFDEALYVPHFAFSATGIATADGKIQPRDSNDMYYIDTEDTAYEFEGFVNADGMQLVTLHLSPDVLNVTVTVDDNELGKFYLMAVPANSPASVKAKVESEKVTSLNVSAETPAFYVLMATTELKDEDGNYQTGDYNATLKLANAASEDDYITLPLTGQLKTTVPTAIEAIDADAAADARYFNLQGVEIKNPTAGQILIRVNGANATKVLVK